MRFWRKKIPKEEPPTFLHLTEEMDKGVTAEQNLESVQGSSVFKASNFEQLIQRVALNDGRGESLHVKVPAIDGVGATVREFRTGVVEIEWFFEKEASVEALRLILDKLMQAGWLKNGQSHLSIHDPLPYLISVEGFSGELSAGAPDTVRLVIRSSTDR